MQTGMGSEGRNQWFGGFGSAFAEKKEKKLKKKKILEACQGAIISQPCESTQTFALDLL